MRSIFPVALAIALVGCASERSAEGEKTAEMHSNWRGTASVPVPVPMPDGSFAWESRQVSFDVYHDQSSNEKTSESEQTVTRADLKAAVEAAIAVGKPVMQAASGNWLGAVGEVGGWLLGVGAAATAVRAQLRNGTLTRAFHQTVSGLKSVRASIGEESWKSQVAPHLREAQDEHVRKVLVPKAESTVSSS